MNSPHHCLLQEAPWLKCIATSNLSLLCGNRLQLKRWGEEAHLRCCYLWLYSEAITHLWCYLHPTPVYDAYQPMLTNVHHFIDAHLLSAAKVISLFPLFSYIPKATPVPLKLPCCVISIGSDWCILGLVSTGTSNIKLQLIQEGGSIRFCEWCQAQSTPRDNWFFILPCHLR